MSSPRIDEIALLGTAIQDHYFDRLNSLRFLIPAWLPTPANRRLARNARRFDAIVDELIAERPIDDDRGDLLSMLLRARDEHGVAMSRREVRDHVVTLLLAGHETTALALTWAWLLLSTHPEARSALEAELDAVLGGRPPTPADVAALPYTRAVLDETLRLRPPAYATGREAVRETSIDGRRLPKGRVVFVSMSATHRDPRFFPEPDAFRPDRWLDGLDAAPSARGVLPIRARPTDVCRCHVRDARGDAHPGDLRPAVAIRSERRPIRARDRRSPSDPPARSRDDWSSAEEPTTGGEHEDWLRR